MLHSSSPRHEGGPNGRVTIPISSGPDQAGIAVREVLFGFFVTANVDCPTTIPESLIANPHTVLVLPANVPKSRITQAAQFAMNACAPPFLVYANPVICPLLLMAYAWLHEPPSVPILIILPLRHTNPKKFPTAS